MKIGILTSGGDAPGMNAAIRSAVRTAIAKSAEPIGIFRGYEGLLQEEITSLFWRDVGGIEVRGGTILKTTRFLPFLEETVQQKAADILQKHHIGALLVIGGDGSMRGAASLEALGVPTAVVPATIDNDMPGTEDTIGYDTAVNTALYAIRKIRDTASAHERAAVLEVMGHHAGHIALAAGLAGGAEFILVPEIPFDETKIAEKLLALTKAGRTNCILICAEGAAHAHELAAKLSAETGLEISATNLGYIQRGGAPSAHDSILATTLAAAATNSLLDGKHGILAGIHQGNVKEISYDEAFAMKRMLPRALWELGRKIGMGE